ncbi:hypothetical protein RIR_jg10814.t1 [Rhizophagus irregularis DAOM 181602=DAOM 197198]|nr:hypothetical protein RIR_jg10814.t1 [Rhizophagus irregularis DAOM 181602=DAOM 197198]
MFDTLVVGKFLKWVVKYHLINLDIKEIRENGEPIISIYLQARTNQLRNYISVTIERGKCYLSLVKAIFQDQVDIYKEDLDNDSAKDYQCKDSLKEKSEKFFGGVYRGSKKMKNNGNN